MKRKIRGWLLAIAIVILLATTYAIFGTYFLPRPSYMSSGRMIVAEPIMIPRDAEVSVPPPEPTDAAIAFRVTAVYTPGVALLLFALFFRRKRVEIATNRLTKR